MLLLLLNVFILLLSPLDISKRYSKFNISFYKKIIACKYIIIYFKSVKYPTIIFLKYKKINKIVILYLNI